MSNDQDNQKFTNAVSGGALAFYLREADERIKDFKGELAYFDDKGFQYDRSKLSANDHDALTIGTQLGDVKLEFVFGLNGTKINAWAVFTDVDIACQPDRKRQLLKVRLGDSGWVGPDGGGYQDRYGRHSMELVLREVLGTKLRLNTEFLNTL